MTAFWIFVGKYWITFLFGLIAAGLGVYIAKIKGVFQRGKQALKEEEEEGILKKAKKISDKKAEEVMKYIKEKHQLCESCSMDQRLANAENTLEILRQGILSLQGKQFKQECKYWLESGQELTLEIFSHLENEHNIYNSLKGNHEGDMLFELITEKYKNSLK